ncbi:MerC family mercury resistance protein [Aquisalimonas lutea]|uniref:MerC family mercury resistance protein n=1 Tax=Aquisalimonas lutea TaxID=1327750 RepID=UPI0025B3D33E|nr:MerC family mercury resistance protein [Aquisalimonas lutea]MDN3518433.1 MerC family mercury resistance protein [Aquisalimonas lutea]
MVAILGYSREQIFAAVKEMYTTVAEAPSSPFHFPVGRPACETLGYTRERIESVPWQLVASFAGVGCPFNGEAVGVGDTALDIGAGAGNDSFIASDMVGPGGRVIAMDITPAMARKLAETVREAGVGNIDVLLGSAEQLPLRDGAVDSITSNGVLNLVPDKRRAVAEMFRVLRPDGRLQIADVVIDRPVSVDCHTDPRLWVECVVGATVEEDFLALFRDAGFEDVHIVRSIDYFAHSPSAQTREIAASFGARSIEVTMRRGPVAPSRARQFLQRMNPRRVVASLWRRGFMGVAGLGLALLTCYGTVVALTLLATLGMGLTLDRTLWSGAIAGFAWLTVAAVAPGSRFHGRPWPAVAAATGAAVVSFALFVHYWFVIELGGFLLLGAAVWWDIRARRRQESRILGLDAHAGS